VVQPALSPVHGAEGADAANVRGARGTPPAAPGGHGTAKVAIVGAGRVGTTLAYTCLVKGVGKSIALYGRDPERLRAEVLDLNHGLQFVPTATVIGSADLEVCRGADVVAVTASAPMVPGRSRLDLAEANVAICRELVPRLVEVAPSAIFLFVTNPVDVVTYAALRISGLPRSQVFGTGTVLDSSRLRQLVAGHCGVAVQNVHAYIVGEHGDSECRCGVRQRSAACHCRSGRTLTFCHWTACNAPCRFRSRLAKPRRCSAQRRRSELSFSDAACEPNRLPR